MGQMAKLNEKVACIMYAEALILSLKAEKLKLKLQRGLGTMLPSPS